MIGIRASTNTAVENPTRVTSQTLIELARAGEQLPLRSVNLRALNSGLYVSPFKGRGMEFDETRPYQPGDDIRSLDWKVTARSGRAHTKLFREERERPVLLWVDLSPTMFFATRGVFKSVMAAKAAALLAWSATAHGDRLGGLIFSDETHRELPPRNGKSGVLRFIQTLSHHPAWDQSNRPVGNPADTVLHAVVRLRNVARPGSLVFLLSDFRHLTAQTESHLNQIARHNDVVLVYISDPLENRLPPAGRYRFSNGIDTLSIDTGDDNLREHYEQRRRAHVERLERLCSRNRIFMLPLGTQDNVVHKLQTSLGLRAK